MAVALLNYIVVNHKGYVRIGLVFAAWAAYDTPALFVALYSVSIALDGAGRQHYKYLLNCVLSAVLFALQWGFLVCALEWCVFVCNHNTRGDQWKKSFSSSPRLIQAIMANGDKCASAFKLMCLMLRGRCCWLQKHVALLRLTNVSPCFSVQAWCIWTHIEYLTSDEMEEKKN
uniref:Uncharacterized protein n=1 Tax=Stegastes partitus TaxID=144197 RepID=A0A3B4ZN97_9TELE